jgi:hypothetical protein
MYSLFLSFLHHPLSSFPYFSLLSSSTFPPSSQKLWDVISGQGAMNLVVHMDDAQEMAKALIRHALNSPKCNDNITIIVVTL